MIWPPPHQALEGRIVRLEPIEPAHREPLRTAAGAPETWTWIYPRIPADPAGFDALFDARLEASRRGEEWCFVTNSRAEGRAVGSSSYLSVRPLHDGLEIGWTWLHPSAWRTGANREAKLLMLSQAFEELGCLRVEFKTDARNERSRAALAALGATYEGTFRRHMRLPDGGVRDSAYYSVTDEDWPAVKTALTERLGEAATRGMRKPSQARTQGRSFVNTKRDPRTRHDEGLQHA